MSEDAPKGPKSEDPKKPFSTSGAYDPPGNGVKWLIGGAAAVALIAGGVFAVNAFGPGKARTEIASADSGYDVSSSATPITAGPVGADQTATSDLAATTADPAPSSSPRPRAARRAEPVPEMVVGVTPASVSDGAENEVVITGAKRPVWTRTPSQRRLSALYPANALDRGREGEASVRCMVQEGGALDCVRVSETPARAGFGNAALRVARTFRHAPERADGSSAVGTPVNLRVVFRIDDGERRRT